MSGAYSNRTGTGIDAAMPPFLLGFSLSLAALLAASAYTGEALAGASYGAWFGVGAAVTPLVLVVPIVGLSGRRLRGAQPQLLRWLTIGAGVALVALRLRRLLYSRVLTVLSGGRAAICRIGCDDPPR
jgi:thiol:disulfide interchange protein DsbD